MATVGKYVEGKARHADTSALEQNADGRVVSCSELYQVVLAAADASVVPSSVSGLPAANAKHPVHADLYVSSYAWRHPAVGSKVWECAVKYDRRTTSTTGASPGRGVRVTLVEWGFADGQGDLVQDASTGLPVVNAAGDPFDSVPLRDEAHPVVRYGFREKTFDGSVLWRNNCINATDVTVLGVDFAPHTCRLKVECRKDLSAEDSPFEWTYTFEGRDNWVDKGACFGPDKKAPETSYATDGDKWNIGWDVALLQCGFRYIDATTRQPVKFVDVDAEQNVIECSSPQLLAYDGQALSPTGTPVYLVVQAYQEADLSGIAPTSA